MRSVEQVDDDQWYTVAGDKNRHKVQLHLNFEEAAELRKNDTISITDGMVAQSGKVINITVSNPNHIKVALQPLFTELTLSDLSWRDMAEPAAEQNTQTPRRPASTSKGSPLKEDRRQAHPGPSSMML